MDADLVVWMVILLADQMAARRDALMDGQMAALMVEMTVIWRALNLGDGLVGGSAV